MIVSIFCLKQCTSVGVGCAAAFYFNYAELLTPLNGITNNNIFFESILLWIAFVCRSSITNGNNLSTTLQRGSS
jgi:hypothetical protein